MSENLEISKNQSYCILGLLIGISLVLKAYTYLTSPPTDLLKSMYVLALLLGLIIIVLVYALTKELTDNNIAALFASSLAMFIPLYSWKTVNFLNHTFAVILLLLTFLALMYVKETRYWRTLTVIPLILSLVHVYSLIFLPIILLYFLLTKLEKKEVSKREYIFAGVSAMFIIGIFIFLTSTPNLLIMTQEYVKVGYYSLAAENFSITKAFLIAGLLPVYLGAIGAYYAIPKKKKMALLMISACGIFLAAMLFNVIPITIGFPYLGLMLACFAGEVFVRFEKTILTSRIKEKLSSLTFALFVIIFVLNLLHFLKFIKY